MHKKKDFLVIKGTSGAHVFFGLRFFEDLIDRIHRIFLSENKMRQYQSVHLFNLLENLHFNTEWIKSYANRSYYRRVGVLRDVLDTAGSLSDGGRYNIGGAQTSSSVVDRFGKIGQKKSALYMSEDAKTARHEYGDLEMPASTAITYIIKLHDSDHLNLVEMDSVFDELSSAIPRIYDLVGFPSMNGTWVDIKFPAPSQVLGHWIKERCPKDTHGIRFKSSHPKASYNVCLFFHDTRECKNRLMATPLL